MTTATFDAFDDALAEYGIPPASTWWRETLGRLYSSGETRLVARVGRGGAKSHTMTKCAVFEALYGTWTVPPGECHYYALVSVSKDEAAERRRLIRQILDALGVPCDSTGDVITLRDRPLGFRVFANDGRAVRGFRCFGFTCDELAFWSYESDAADPASEVIASLEAMTVTHPKAKSFFVSSPWSHDDEHARMYDAGVGVTAQAPSWIANPAVNTRESCLAKARGDMRLFRRDYEGIPQAAESAVFDPEDLTRAFEREPPQQWREFFLAIDASGLSARGDTFAWAVCGVAEDGTLHVVHVDGVRGSEGRTTRHVIDRLVETAAQCGATRAFGDQHSSKWIADALAGTRLHFQQLAWTADSKMVAVDELRRLMRDNQIGLVNEPRLKEELFGLQGRLSPNGRETFHTNGRDFASTVITACLAVAQHYVQGVGVRGNGLAAWADPDFVAGMYALMIANRTEPRSVAERIERAEEDRELRRTLGFARWLRLMRGERDFDRDPQHPWGNPFGRAKKKDDPDDGEGEGGAPPIAAA